ncbi:hypothetical protein ABZ554_47685, partial [Streptomyces sp. NPDC020125]
MSGSATGPLPSAASFWPEPTPLDPRSAPLPKYGTGSLADLLPAVAAGQEVPGLSSGLGLAPADRVCVFLVDGLGWELLRAHPGEAPFLWSRSAYFCRTRRPGAPSSPP